MNIPAEAAAEDFPDADMTELGDAMLNAKALNSWLHTNYTPEQAADLDWLVYVIFGAVRQGMEPEQKSQETAPK